MYTFLEVSIIVNLGYCNFVGSWEITEGFRTHTHTKNEDLKKSFI